MVKDHRQHPETRRKLYRNEKKSKLHETCESLYVLQMPNFILAIYGQLIIQKIKFRMGCDGILIICNIFKPIV